MAGLPLTIAPQATTSYSTLPGSPITIATTATTATGGGLTLDSSGIPSADGTTNSRHSVDTALSLALTETSRVTRTAAYTTLAITSSETIHTVKHTTLATSPFSSETSDSPTSVSTPLASPSTSQISSNTSQIPVGPSTMKAPGGRSLPVGTIMGVTLGLLIFFLLSAVLMRYWKHSKRRLRSTMHVVPTPLLHQPDYVPPRLEKNEQTVRQPLVPATALLPSAGGLDIEKHHEDRVQLISPRDSEVDLLQYPFAQPSSTPGGAATAEELVHLRECVLYLESRLLGSSAPPDYWSEHFQ